MSNSSSPPLDFCHKVTAHNRETLSSTLTSEYVQNVFSGRISVDVTWSKRLLTTAGVTRLKKRGVVRTASVELSVKVLTDVERLKSTLLHELCHVAQWTLDNNKAPSHGKVFEKWRDKVR